MRRAVGVAGGVGARRRGGAALVRAFAASRARCGLPRDGVEAAEDQPFEADAYDVLLQDTEGFLWQPGSVTRPDEALIPELSSQELAPDNRISGVIAYVVPEEAVIDVVFYQPEGGRLISLGRSASSGD